MYTSQEDAGLIGRHSKSIQDSLCFRQFMKIRVNYLLFLDLFKRKEILKILSLSLPFLRFFSNFLFSSFYSHPFFLRSYRAVSLIWKTRISRIIFNCFSSSKHPELLERQPTRRDPKSSSYVVFVLRLCTRVIRRLLWFMSEAGGHNRKRFHCDDVKAVHNSMLGDFCTLAARQDLHFYMVLWDHSCSVPFFHLSRDICVLCLDFSQLFFSREALGSFFKNRTRCIIKSFTLFSFLLFFLSVVQFDLPFRGAEY